jgi:hypothetical protein
VLDGHIARQKAILAAWAIILRQNAQASQPLTHLARRSVAEKRHKQDARVRKFLVAASGSSAIGVQRHAPATRSVSGLIRSGSGRSAADG